MRRKGTDFFLQNSPKRCHGNIHSLIFKHAQQIVLIPRLIRLPRGGRATDDEGGVAGDVAHELEGARLLVQFFDEGAVELVVGGDELGQGVLLWDRVVL